MKAGREPLRTFGDLKQFFETRTGDAEPSTPPKRVDQPNEESGITNPSAIPPAPASLPAPVSDTAAGGDPVSGGDTSQVGDGHPD